MQVCGCCKTDQDTLHATEITLYSHRVIEMADGTHSLLSLRIIQMMQNGNFSVERAYEHISSVGNHRHHLLINWSKRWKLKTPPRLLLFGWKLARNLLPTRANLISRTIINESSCLLCSEDREDVNRLLLFCPAIKAPSFVTLLPQELL